MNIQTVRTMRMANKRRTISRKALYEQIICTLFLIPFFQCEGLMAIGMDYTPIKWIGGATILIVAFPTMRYLNKSCFFYAFFYLSILFSTFLNHRDIKPAISMSIQMVGFLLFVNYYAYRRKLRCLIISMKRFFGLLILINLYIQIAHQDIFGLTTSKNIINLIASDNFQGYWYVSFILIVYLADFGKSDTFVFADMCFWVTVCLVSLIRGWAATCLCIFVVFIILFMFYHLRIMNIFTPWTSLLICGLVSFLVIGLQIQKYFDWLIVDILQKDLTLSSRTYIWASAIMNILKKPIWGYGTTSGGRLSINQLSIGFSKSTFFSHNVFLEILIQGGVVAMVFFVLIYIGANRSLKYKEGNSNLKVVLSISVFSLLLMQFTEFAIYMSVANIPIVLCFFYRELEIEGFDRRVSRDIPLLMDKWNIRL